MSSYDYDVVIIGSGPSGIAAATALSNAGIKNIIVYEREANIGGIPRHTHHPSFGLLVFKRPISGPKYIKKLVQRCPDVRFEVNTTLVAIRPNGELDIATDKGINTVKARHVILATGARETPRHPRLVSGLRPMGITTTGALQQFIYGAEIRPFNHPVIVGTELVSFSALWTLRSAGIKPVAMIEENSRITAYRPATFVARIFGVPILYNTKITDIKDIENLAQVTIQGSNSIPQEIKCDGIIFSGKFVGENTIARASHLGIHSKTQLPQVDQNWISSDSNISVIGNSTHPADMGDQCYQEGVKAGEYVADIFINKAISTDSFLTINHHDIIKMTTPNIVRKNKTENTVFNLSFHVNNPYTGAVRVSCGDKVLYEKKHRCMPARRITLKNIKLTNKEFDVGSIIVSLGV